MAQHSLENLSDLNKKIYHAFVGALPFAESIQFMAKFIANLEEVYGEEAESRIVTAMRSVLVQAVTNTNAPVDHTLYAIKYLSEALNMFQSPNKNQESEDAQYDNSSESYSDDSDSSFDDTDWEPLTDATPLLQLQ